MAQRGAPEAPRQALGVLIASEFALCAIRARGDCIAPMPRARRPVLLSVPRSSAVCQLAVIAWECAATRQIDICRGERRERSRDREREREIRFDMGDMRRVLVGAGGSTACKPRCAFLGEEGILANCTVGQNTTLHLYPRICRDGGWRGGSSSGERGRGAPSSKILENFSPAPFPGVPCSPSNIIKHLLVAVGYPLVPTLWGRKCTRIPPDTTGYHPDTTPGYHRIPPGLEGWMPLYFPHVGVANARGYPGYHPETPLETTPGNHRIASRLEGWILLLFSTRWGRKRARIPPGTTPGNHLRIPQDTTWVGGLNTPLVSTLGGRKRARIPPGTTGYHPPPRYLD